VAHLKCPRCGLCSPESAEHCDCGFEFQSTTANPSKSSDITQLVLQGNQGKTLYVSGDTIRIEKQGLLTGKREKTILLGM
jgi:ribosomal protein L28